MPARPPIAKTWHWLPDLLREIAERCGIEVALRFAEQLGGGYLQVPARIGAEHELMRDWGEEVVAVLLAARARQGHGKLVVPLATMELEAAARAERRDQVRRLTAQGVNSTAIARRLGVHVRTVHADRAAMRAEGESRQMGLFDDGQAA